MAPRVQTTVRKKVVTKEWTSKPVTEDPHDAEGNYEEGGTEARSGVKVPESDFEDRLGRIFEVKPDREYSEKQEPIKRPSDYYEPPFYAPHLPLETRVNYNVLREPGPCSTADKTTILNPWLNDKKYKNQNQRAKSASVKAKTKPRIASQKLQSRRESVQTKSIQGRKLDFESNQETPGFKDYQNLISQETPTLSNRRKVYSELISKKQA